MYVQFMIFSFLKCVYLNYWTLVEPPFKLYFFSQERIPTVKP